VLGDVPTETVVTVCGTGKISRSSARHLRRNGIDAHNLAGGMEAWAELAVETELPTDADATVVQFQRPATGCLSYLVVSGKQAAVIDPLLSFTDEYVAVAEAHGSDIVYAIDTHVHADHVSGLRALAEGTDATTLLPAAAVDRGLDYQTPYETVDDGDTLAVGSSTIEAVHTPGHTSGMTTYALEDAVLFTGDGVFVESVARPDLEAGADGAPEAATQLYESLHDRILPYPDDTLVAPGHYSAGVEPGTDESYAAPLGTVTERLDALSDPVEAFVEATLADMPPRPANHTRIIATNLGQRSLPRDRALRLERGPNNCAATAVSSAD
jgi:glyoxylase-like metal-dependent hydrolase (beta-lactamase superfamily II)